jgi:uncharacterized Zn finger protein
MNGAKESCYCGRAGDIEDHDPLIDAYGQRALRCPDCGHVDDLRWLSEDARRLVLEKAERREVAARPLTA